MAALVGANGNDADMAFDIQGLCEWILNLLEDAEEFEAQMARLERYIVGGNIKASNLNGTGQQEEQVRRKDFATSCDACDVPLGVSSKMYKELTRQRRKHANWGGDQLQEAEDRGAAAQGARRQVGIHR